MSIATGVSLLIILVLIIVFGYFLYTNAVSKRRIRREVYEADEVLHKTFDLLLEDTQEQIGLLENAKTKRELTEEEEKIVTQLRKNLAVAERFIKKEIEDIEKEIG